MATHRRRIGSVLLLLVLCSSPAAWSETVSESEAHEGKNLCGVYSLYLLLSTKGVETSIDELKTLTGYDAKTGTTSEGLCRAGAAKGVPLYALQYDNVQALKRLPLPAILHYKYSHFVVLASISGDEFETLDAPMRTTLSAETLAQKWSGVVLATRKPPSRAPYGVSLVACGVAAASWPLLRRRRRRLATLLLISCVAGLGGLGCGGEASSAAFEYKGRLVQTHDFGFVPEGETVKHTFTLTNDSDETWSLKDIRTSCGCSHGKPDKDQLAPGESGTVEVSFEPKRQDSAQQQAIFIRLTDEPERQYELVVQARCKYALHWSPDAVQLRTAAAKGAVVELRLSLPDYSVSRLAVLEAKTEHDFVAVAPMELADAHHGRVRVTVLDSAPVGRHSGKLRLRTSVEGREEVVFPYDVLIEEALVAEPSTLVMKAGQPDTLRQRLQLRAVAPVALPEIQAGEPPVPAIHIDRVTQAVSSDSALFEVSVVGDWPETGSEWLDFITDCPQQPLIRVPILFVR